MKFLKGSDLTSEIQRLVSTSNAKIAISYWGIHALDRLKKKLDPKRSDLQIVCCLKGGKSAPEVIKQFGKKARQNDKLHAKVIWTPSGAIVGSANASSNGLPEEENQVDGLIEAGVFLEDASVLESIESWFDKLYKDARPITDADLEAAKKARVDRWKSKPELISMPVNELKQQKIAVLLWSEQMTDEEIGQVEKLDEPLLKLRNVDYYADTRKHATEYPYGYVAITFETNKVRSKLLGGNELQSFRPQTKWHTIDTKRKSKLNHIIFAFELEKSDIARLGFKIGRASIARIRALLEKRKLKLSHYLDSGEEGFTSWEPLHELLAESTTP
jgi:hypothetical protein